MTLRPPITADDLRRKLTPREFEVARALSNDLTPGDIAREFDRSVHTIYTQLERTKFKLGVNTHVGIARVFWQAGL